MLGKLREHEFEGPMTTGAMVLDKENKRGVRSEEAWL